jgi:flagellar motor switch protein FliM
VTPLLSKAEVDALLQDVELLGSPAADVPVALPSVVAATSSAASAACAVDAGLEVVVDRFLPPPPDDIRSAPRAASERRGRGARAVRFRDVRDHVPQPATLQLFRMPPLRGLGLLGMSPRARGLVLEVSLGGRAGRSTPVAEREPSRSTCACSSGSAAGSCHDLGRPGGRVAAVEFALLRSEQNPLLAAIAVRRISCSAST